MCNVNDCIHNYIYIFQKYYLMLMVFIMPQFTVETYCFADSLCLFKPPQSVLYHWNQYDKEISKSVGLSIHNTNKKKPTPSLLTVEK